MTNFDTFENVRFGMETPQKNVKNDEMEYKTSYVYFLTNLERFQCFKPKYDHFEVQTKNAHKRGLPVNPL